MPWRLLQFELRTAILLLVTAAIACWWWGPTDFQALWMRTAYPDDQTVAEQPVCLSQSRHGLSGSLMADGAMLLDWNLENDTRAQEVLICEFSCPPFLHPEFRSRASGLFVLASASTQISEFRPRHELFLLQVPKDARLIEVTEEQVWFADRLVAAILLSPLLLQLSKNVRKCYASRRASSLSHTVLARVGADTTCAVQRERDNQH